jgi:hypothetical protein
MNIYVTHRTANFSDDRVHRYQLGRYWDESKPPLTWLMLNPSIADEQQEDPTIRRTIGFTISAKTLARESGGTAGPFGGVEIVNMFGLVSTDPRALLSHPDPIGPGNDSAITHACVLGDGIVVCAWGDLKHPAMKQRALRICRELYDLDIQLFCLRTTKHGHPSHPLYLPGSLLPVPWTNWESMR